MTDLRAELASPNVETRYRAIIRAGKTGRLDLRDEIERFIGDADEGMREAAIKTLAFYWRLPEYEAVARRLVREDVDVDVRAAAAMALGGFASADNVRLLLEIALDADEDEGVRHMAYSGALLAAGIPKNEYPMERTVPGFERRANWALLARYVAAAGVEVPERLRELAA